MKILCIYSSIVIRGLAVGVVWIRAALNDGNSECWKEEDEIERSTDWVSYYFPGLELYKS